MEKSKLYQWTIPALILVVLVVLIALTQSKDEVLGYWGESYQATTTNYRTTVGMRTVNDTVASSTQVLALNNDRQYARCQNVNTNGYPVTLMLGSTATTSVALNGIVLAPVASNTPWSVFELNRDNQFTGAIYAYAQSTSTVICVEN